MRAAAGHPLLLARGPYRAEVVTVGACLRTLTRDGLDLVAGTPARAMCASFRGAVLMPWPNRVGDGRYDFAGEHHQLPLTEPEHGNALHGLVHWVPWAVAEHTEERAVLRYELPAQPGYPWSLDLQVSYELGDQGLTTTLAARNRSAAVAPYGAGLHPYLTVGRPLDECLLTLPADTRCETDDRGLPAPAQPVAGTAYDFRAARTLRGVVLDHPFGGVRAGSSAVLADPDSGRAVRLTVGEGLGWLHAFTGEPLPWGARESLALEPMTCPPDAFRSGVDLVELDPGETHTVSCTITGS